LIMGALLYSCPGDNTLSTTGTRVNDDTTILYRATKHDCAGCALLGVARL